LELDRHGLELLTPEISFAHTFSNGQTMRMHENLEQMCASIATHSTQSWTILDWAFKAPSSTRKE
jgi:phytoene dehydrogenase-like protein